MVTTASEAAPVHHATEIYATLCPTNEFEVLIIKQTARSWSPTAATGRGSKQAESRSGCPSASSGTIRCTVSICLASQPIPAVPIWTATPCIQQHVRWTPTGCSTAIPNPFIELRASNGPRASSDSANGTSALWPATEPVRTSDYSGWETASVHNGSAARRYSSRYSKSRKPS